MNIAVDVDGVLANHVPHILRRVREKLAVTFYKSKVKLWNQPIPNTNTTIDREIESALTVPTYILTMPIVPGARKGIEALSRLGHTIVIATSRPPETDSYSKQWLIKKKIPFDHFINTRANGKLNLHADILIDDRLENVQEFARTKGFAILFLQPWNEKKDHLVDLIKSRRLGCAKGWPQVVEIVLLLSTKHNIELALPDKQPSAILRI